MDGSNADEKAVVEFDQPFYFAYLAFEGAIEVKEGVAHVVSQRDGRGGAGKAVQSRSICVGMRTIGLRCGPG